MADVDAAEQAVPVDVVRLPLVEVGQRFILGRALRHRGDQVRDGQHPLVQVVDLAVARREVAPHAAAQEARRG